MPNTADIAAQAGVRAILEDWARRIDDDGTPSQIVSAEEIRAALAAIEPQAVAETLHGPFGWLNGRRDLSEEHWTLERDPLENSDEHFAIPLFAKVDPFKEAKPDALDRLLNFIVSDDTPVRPEDEADLRLFNEATMEGIAKFALRAAAASPVTASDEKAVARADRGLIEEVASFVRERVANIQRNFTERSTNRIEAEALLARMEAAPITASDAPANVEDEFFYDPRTGRVAGSEPVTASDERAVEAKNRAQGMVRSMDQWRNMVPKAVMAGSQAQIEYALIDAKHDIEAMWSVLTALAAAPKAQPVQGLVSHKTALGDTQQDLPIADDSQASHPVQGWQTESGIERRARARDWLRNRWSEPHPNEGHVKQLADYAAFLAAAPLPAGPSSKETASAADQIIGQIEERFPNWRSYRDLIDCIDCTLADLRRAGQ